MKEVMSRIRKVMFLFIGVAVVTMLSAGGAYCAGTNVTAKYDAVKNKYDIARYQWYDLYASGVMVKAPEA